MLDIENIWKDKFNDEQLNEENWLEPNEKVLNNVMGSIKKKRKRKIFFLIFLIGIAFLSTFIIWSVTIPVGTKINAEVVGDQKTEIPKDIIRADIKASSSNSQNSVVAAIEDYDGANDRDQSKDGLAIIHDLNSHAFDVKKSANSASREKDTAPINESEWISSNIESNKEAEVEMGQRSGISSLDKTLDKLSYLEPIYGNFHEETQRAKIELTITPENIIVHNSSKRRTIGILNKYSIWNLDLNDNYEFALAPADFFHERGRSFAWGIRFSENINERLSWGMDLNYESAYFKSGHNSVLTYDVQNEQNGLAINEYDITMASPIGFISSDIVISRSSDQVNAPTDFVIDLHNSHRIKNLDLMSFLNYRLLNYKNIGFHLNLGLGINKFFGVNNQLDSFGSSNSDLIPLSSQVIEYASSINNITFYNSIGFNIDYDISPNYTLNFLFNYSKDFDLIYNEADFNSRLSRLQMGIEFAKKF